MHINILLVVLQTLSVFQSPQYIVPDSISQGEIAIIDLSQFSAHNSINYLDLSATFNGDEVPSFSRSDKSYALVAIDYRKRIGIYQFVVSLAGNEIYRDSIAVTNGNFPEIIYTREYQPRDSLRKDPSLGQRFTEERAIKQRIFSTNTDARQWESSFFNPLDTIIVTSEFGLRRYYNNQSSVLVDSTRHGGIDLRVKNDPAGTLPHKQVRAISDGNIVWDGSQSLYYEGNMLVVDHGLGVLAVYLHLGEIYVSEGDNVVAGQIIARGGNSAGYQLAPHLHFEIRVGGKRLHPLSFIETMQQFYEN